MADFTATISGGTTLTATDDGETITVTSSASSVTVTIEDAPPAGGPTYAEILRDTYGASEIYPLTNIPSGTNIPAFISAAHDGTLVGWDLKNAAGPVPGTLAPYLNGSTGTGNIGSLALIFNGAIGSMVIFGKVSAVGDWSDGVGRKLALYKYDANNWIYLAKHGTLGLELYIAIGGNATIRRSAQTTTDWFMFGLSWKDSANGNEVKLFVNGAQVGATITGFGAWGGAPTALSLGTTSPNADVWKGWIGYHALKFGSAWTPTEMAAIYADRLTGGPDVNP